MIGIFEVHAQLVGIGTETPNSKLQINSEVGTNPLRVQINRLTKLLVHNNGGVSIGINETPPPEGLYVEGIVGIGVESPAATLHVKSDQSVNLSSGGGFIVGDIEGLNLVMDKTNIMARLNGSSAPLFINNRGGNLIYNSFDQTGNVGIGTSVPTARLHIRQGHANKGIVIQHESNQEYWSVGIGVNSFNYRFEFNSSLRAQIESIDGSYLTGSDIRLKENITPVSPMLDRVMELRACNYYYKDSHARAKNASLGFIAQEVEPIFPELVYDMDGGYKGLNYSGFAVVAIKAIQEQQDKVQSLEERIAKLELLLSDKHSVNKF
jgi:hypothetical protein